MITINCLRQSNETINFYLYNWRWYTI